MDRRIPKKGEIYRHFKGRKYKILDIAVCTETGEDMVIFETAEGTRKVFASFLENFLSPLDAGKYPHTEQKYRFELCRDTKSSELLRLKRHGNTTSLILEFLDLLYQLQLLDIRIGNENRHVLVITHCCGIGEDVESGFPELRLYFLCD